MVEREKYQIERAELLSGIIASAVKRAVAAERERCAQEAHIECMVQGLDEPKAKAVAAAIKRG